MKPVKLRYDGKYNFLPPAEARQWTIMSHFIDAQGADRYRGSFSEQSLRELGILPEHRRETEKP